MVPEAGAFFGRRNTWNIIFRERYKRFFTPYVLRLIVVPPRSEADWRKPHKSDGTRLWKLRGRTDVRERHGARSLMARNSMERLVASTIWSREGSFFPVHGVNSALPSIYKFGIMLVL